MADIIDFKLNNGDLAYTSNGDLLLVSNIDNIWQAATLRVNTVLGTYVFDENFGTLLGQYVDEPLTDDLKNKIESEVKNTLLNDTRITSVSNVQVSLLDSGINVYLTITTPYGVKTGNIQTGG